MRVILVRHGDADADIPEGLDDEARALTAKARVSLPAHFAQMADRIGAVDLILMSPLVRTVQTASLLCHALGYQGTMRSHRALFPNGPVGSIETLLEDCRGKTIVLIGHQPSIGAATAHFLGLTSFPKPVAPGTAIGIDRPDDSPHVGSLLFYAAPGQLIVDAIAPTLNVQP